MFYIVIQAICGLLCSTLIWAMKKSRIPVTREEIFIWKIRDFQWLRCVTPPFEFGGSTASLSSTRQKFNSSEGISSCFRHGCGMEFEHIPETVSKDVNL